MLAQHLARESIQLDHRITLNRLAHQTLLEECPCDPLPLFGAMLFTHTIRLEPIMLILADTFGVGSAQNINDMPHPKTPASFAHAPEKTARINRAILKDRLDPLAVITIATIIKGIDLRKVAQQRAA